MIGKLKNQLATARQIVQELEGYEQQAAALGPQGEKMIAVAERALRERLRGAVEGIPEMLEERYVSQEMPALPMQAEVQEPAVQEQPQQVVVSPVSASTAQHVVAAQPTPVVAASLADPVSSTGGSKMKLSGAEKTKLLEELSLKKGFGKELGKGKAGEKEAATELVQGLRKTSGYLKLSNKFFGGMAGKMVRGGKFKTLGGDLQKANVDVLFQTYVATVFFSTFLSFFVGLFFLAGLVGVRVLTGASLVGALLGWFWIPLVLPVLTFLALLYYPSTEQGSLSKRINQELPFAVVHMSAISGSGIEPSQIFKIIGMSQEYKALRGEIRKVMNQINVYGYDLVTSLTNVAKATPSQKLADLFNGLATTIHTGGELKGFLDKRSETLLQDYKLEREKFTKVAETFMDIYISVVIAMPMILMLVLVIMSVSGLNIGLSPMAMAVGIVFLIAVVNVIFMGVLQAKQPAY